MQDSTRSLRERKKARTRQALIEAAFRLYRAQGFDNVTVAEIAQEADVAPRTFFGYFEAKEDVFLGRGDDRLERLVQAIRSRGHRLPVLEAVRRELQRGLTARERQSRARADRPELSELLRHPAIANRLRERWNRWEDRLAEAIAEDAGARPSDPEPRVVAAALTGAIRVASSAVEQQPRRRKAIAERAFALLGPDLARYGATSAREKREIRRS